MRESTPTKAPATRRLAQRFRTVGVRSTHCCQPKNAVATKARVAHLLYRQTMSPLFRFSSAMIRSPDVEIWMRWQKGEMGRIASHWFEVMHGCGGDVREVLHDGHPTACVGDAAFAYVDTFTTHVNVGFFFGAQLPDPKNLLEGTGKAMRHVKVRPGAPLDTEALTQLVRVAYADMKQRVLKERKG